MKLARILPALLVSAAIPIGVAGPLAAQSGPTFAVDAGPDGRALVRAPGLLRDEGLRSAAESGLPLRYTLRVELWRKAFFDQLVGAEEIDAAVVYDPLAREYELDHGGGGARLPTLDAAHAALERTFRPGLAPSRPGRYYYLATLQVETLSLSDLDELRRWLRGEVRPAVEGRRSPTRAVETGLRRIFVRVIGLPSRNYEDRSATFIVR